MTEQEPNREITQEVVDDALARKVKVVLKGNQARQDILIEGKDPSETGVIFPPFLRLLDRRPIMLLGNY